MNSPPYLCSARVLEIFLRDIAGTALRQPRSSSRTLYTLRRPQSLAVGPRHSRLSRSSIFSVAKSGDDDCLPFDHVGDSTTDATRKKLFRTGPDLKGSSDDHFREDWHAELEIAEPWLQGTQAPPNGPVIEVGWQKPVREALDEQPNFTDSTAVGAAKASIVAHRDHIRTGSRPPSLTGTGERRKVSDRSKSAARTAHESNPRHKPRHLPPYEIRKPAQSQEFVHALTAPLPRSAHASSADREATKDAGKRDVNDEPSRNTISGAHLSANTSVKQFTQIKNNGASGREEHINAKIRNSAASMIAKSIPEAVEDQPNRDREQWQIQKHALKTKFGERGWQPRKRLSPDTMEGIRALHRSDPDSYTTPVLAEHFKVSAEAIRRILRSKWRPNEEEAEDRRKRWEKRGERKWTEMAAQGVRPPAKWRAKGIRTPQAERKKGARLSGSEQVRWENRGLANAGLSLASRIV